MRVGKAEAMQGTPLMADPSGTEAAESRSGCLGFVVLMLVAAVLDSLLVVLGVLAFRWVTGS